MILDSFSLEGRVALVVGASRGIGRAIAIGLAEAGATVALSARSEAALDDVAREIADRGGPRASVVPLDVSKTSSIAPAVDQIREEHGRIDVLHNVAGINIREPVFEVSEEDYDSVMDTNLKGLYFTCQAAGSVMAEQGQGKIVNIASLTSAIGLSNATVYTATKGAVSQLTKGLAMEWARYHIQVNAIAPGFIETDLIRRLWRPEMFEWAQRETPAGRLGQPEDVVGLAVFLSSPASDFVTGQTIFVDGGFLAGRKTPGTERLKD